MGPHLGFVQGNMSWGWREGGCPDSVQMVPHFAVGKVSRPWEWLYVLKPESLVSLHKRARVLRVRAVCHSISSCSRDSLPFTPAV